MSFFSRLLGRPEAPEPLIPPMRLDELDAVCAATRPEPAPILPALPEPVAVVAEPAPPVAPRPNVQIGPHVTLPVGWCCDRPYAARHDSWCQTRDASRFPLAGPRGPLVTDPRWVHLNRKDGGSDVL